MNDNIRLLHDILDLVKENGLYNEDLRLVNDVTQIDEYELTQEYLDTFDRVYFSTDIYSTKVDGEDCVELRCFLAFGEIMDEGFENLGKFIVKGCSLENYKLMGEYAGILMYYSYQCLEKYYKIPTE